MTKIDPIALAFDVFMLAVTLAAIIAMFSVLAGR
jgi:hypothetical protein